MESFFEEVESTRVDRKTAKGFENKHLLLWGAEIYSMVEAHFEGYSHPALVFNLIQGNTTDLKNPDSVKYVIGLFNAIKEKTGFTMGECFWFQDKETERNVAKTEINTLTKTQGLGICYLIVAKPKNRLIAEIQYAISKKFRQEK